MQNILKRKNLKKLSISIVSILSLVLIILSCFAPLTYAASKKNSYSSNVAFATTVTGPTRKYEGQNIAISMTTYIDRPASPYAYSNEFAVSLYRKNFLGNSKIGTAYFPRDSKGKVIVKKWSNVGPGNYYFFFSKGFDKANIKSNNVKMYNY